MMIYKQLFDRVSMNAYVRTIDKEVMKEKEVKGNDN
jgi:hypothetical protein